MAIPQLVEVGRVSQLILPKHFGETHDIYVSIGPEARFGWSIMGGAPNTIGTATVTIPTGRVLEVVSDTYRVHIEDPNDSIRIKHRRTTRDFPDAHRPTLTIMNEGGETADLARVGAIAVSQHVVEDGLTLPGIQFEGLDVERFLDAENTAGNEQLTSRSFVNIRRSRVNGQDFDSQTNTYVKNVVARRFTISPVDGLHVVEI